MSPKLALRILLFSSFFLVVFLLALYRVQVEYNSVTLANLEHQAQIERQINEAENVLEEDVGSGKTFSEIKEELIDADMKRYGTVTFETAKKIMEMNNKEVRRKMGLPPE